MKQFLLLLAALCGLCLSSSANEAGLAKNICCELFSEGNTAAVIRGNFIYEGDVIILAVFEK